MRFDKHLTPAERVDAWRHGIAYKLASMEILPSEFYKMAQETKKDLTSWLKPILYVSLMTGIPLGGLAYMINNQVSQSSSGNKVLRQKREYYRDLASQLKNTLEDENGNS